MSHARTILGAFGAEERLANDELMRRTGLTVQQLAVELSRLRDAGSIEYAAGRRTRPAVHQLSGAARAAALGLESTESIVTHAVRTQPNSVFALGTS